MVGSSIFKLLKSKGYKNIITRTRKQLNLLNQKDTLVFLEKYKPESVIIAAARVGGINANNQYRADFLYENLQIQNNLIHGSFISGINKLIFLGSSCIYPKSCKQPIKEEYLLTSKLEKTNEPYAIAKIAGLKLCENYNKQYNKNYLCLMPCNLFGPNDNYDLDNSHFLPAIIRKVHEAKIKNLKNITIWGDGKPKRELMYVDDLANAIFFFLKRNINEHFINIGSGMEYTISNYVDLVIKEIGFKGSIKFNKKMPNGTMRKIMDSSLAQKYGWKTKYNFKEALKKTYTDFLKKEELMK